MTDNKEFLGKESIGKLLFKLAIPSVLAQVVNMLYNVIDRIYIGHMKDVGSIALTGVGVCLPLILIVSAFAALISSGGAPRASIKMGEKKYADAEEILGNCFTLQIIISIVLTILLLLFSEPLLMAFGGSSDTISYATSYMNIYAIGTIFVQLTLGMNGFISCQGFTKHSMISVAIGAMVNIILDPIFIFTLDMGIKGAAIATVLAQICSLVWIILFFTNKRAVVHFEKGIFVLDPRIVKESFAIGLAPFLMNFVSCFIVIVINKSLKIYGGDLSIGAYGIVNRIVFVFIMVVMGLTQGMQPIVGYNYGSRQIDRVFEALKKTIFYATLVLTLGFVVCMFFPRTVVSIFTTDEQLLQKSAEGLKYIVLMFPLVASSMVIGNFFQSIGKPKRSIFMSLSRQLIFLLPCLWILPPIFGTLGVWYSFAVSDFLATVVAYIILYLFLKKYKQTNEI